MAWPLRCWRAAARRCTHTPIIRRIGVDAAGRYAVTASDDKTARAWNLASGKQLAMLQRWPRPAKLPRSIDAASGPDLSEGLTGEASGAEPAWGFKMPQGGLILFETRAERRCLLAGVRARNPPVN